MSNKIETYRGDSFTRTMTFSDVDGNAIDLTGAIVWFTVKEKETDTDENAIVKEKITEHTDPENGLTTISIDKDVFSVVGNYLYDIQLKLTSGTVVTILKDKFKVIQDITQENE